MIGNFIGDFVKGKQHNNYPRSMQQGILLHRAIDHFTDQHHVVLETTDLMRPSFGRYSGIVLDMYFDYFLAHNFQKYSSLSFHLFCFRFYARVLLHYFNLPKKVRSFIFHFIGSHRLNKYRSKKGLFETLEIMHKYKSEAIDPEKIIDFLTVNEEYLLQQFELFFVELQSFVHHRFLVAKSDSL